MPPYQVNIVGGSCSPKIFHKEFLWVLAQRLNSIWDWLGVVYPFFKASFLLAVYVSVC